MNRLKLLLQKIRPEPIKRMSLPVALETMALLARHLRTYSPILAALGSEKEKEVRQALVEKFAEQLLQDKQAKEDVLKILSNLIGEGVVEFNYDLIAKKLRQAWKVNGLSKLLEACLRIGIYDRKDFANLDWVVQNWTTLRK